MPNNFQNEIDTALGEMSDNIKIDVDTLNAKAEEYANELVENVTKVFQNKEWIDSHPQVADRLKIELESLRGLVKMRTANEFAHDALIRAIGNNNLNASLYRSLSEIQKTNLNITTKINDIIGIINNLMRGFQLDIPFEENENKENDSQIFRGSKDFIKEMNKNT